MSQEIVRSLHARVEELVEKAPVHQQARFRAEVGYPDASRETFDDFETLLTRAAEERDPERLELRWEGILAEPAGMPFKIRVVLVTEKHVATDERSVQSFNVALAGTDVCGGSEDWVDQVFRTVNNHILTARIGGIYRPLYVFRTRDVVMYTSIGAGLFAQLMTFSTVSNLVDSAQQRESLRAILAAHTLRQEFARFAKRYFAPQPPDFVYGFVAGFAVFVIVSALTFLILPRLVPISTIELSNLSRVRITRLRNQISLVIFTLLLGGILLPLLARSVQ